VITVFVDSGGFFGNMDADDAHHERACELFVRARTEHWRLITTNAVVYETHALLTARARDRRAALRFLDAIDARLCAVHRIGPDDERAALAILRSHADKGYSYCDALSFAVMERSGITHAIAFDRHFREYGRWTLL
jgi:predicted nucleic acid-binding protein